MSVWGIPFAGCLPRVQGCKEETLKSLTHLFGDGENLTLYGEPVRKGHGLESGYLVKNTDSLQNMFCNEHDGHLGLKEYSDLWGNGKHVMRRFRANLDVGWRVFTELCWAHLRRWRRLARDLRSNSQPPSDKQKKQQRLIGETTQAMATMLKEAEGILDVDAGLMRCKVCSTRVVNVRMMCGHAVCSDCFISSAAHSAENGAYVSSRCPSCNTHRCLAVEMGPHVAAQGEELRAQPSIGRVTKDMVGGIPEDAKDDIARLDEWNEKLQLGRNAGSWCEREWRERASLFVNLEKEACDVVKSKGPDSQAARMLQAVAILHLAWARATPAGERFLEGGTNALLEEFEEAMNEFDRAAAIMRNAAGRDDPRNKYREALILVQKKEGRLLLEKAWSIHKEAGREEYKLEHLASIKYSLAGAGVAVRNLQGVPVMPKENLEGALQDFESQLQEYNLPADKTQEVDDPTSNTHFAISDAARLNIVALRLCLGFWNVFLATGENAAHNLEGCGRFQEEAQEAYKAAAQVVDERISREGLQIPCGQTCNVGAFERILSVVTSAHAEMSKHGLLDEMITDSVSNPVVEQNSGQEGDASNGGWAAAYEALALGKRSFEDFGMDEIDFVWRRQRVKE